MDEKSILRQAIPFAHIISDDELDGIIVRLFQARDNATRLADEAEQANAPRYLHHAAKALADALGEIALDLDNLQGMSDGVHTGQLKMELEQKRRKGAA